MKTLYWIADLYVRINLKSYLSATIKQSRSPETSWQTKSGDIINKRNLNKKLRCNK